MTWGMDSGEYIVHDKTNGYRTALSNSYLTETPSLLLINIFDNIASC